MDLLGEEQDDPNMMSLSDMRAQLLEARMTGNSPAAGPPKKKGVNRVR